MLCRNGGGGINEMCLKYPMKWIGFSPRACQYVMLTAFHALNEASLKVNDCLIIFGASGRSAYKILNAQTMTRKHIHVHKWVISS